MSTTPDTTERIKAQGAGEVLLELLQAGSAPPDALHEALIYVPPELHRDFLRPVQKFIERAPHPAQEVTP